MLDTSAIVGMIRRRSPVPVERLAAYGCDAWALSSVAVVELWYGVEHSQPVERSRLALRTILASLRVADFDEAAAQAYGTLRTDLEKRGLVIGRLVMLIAARALSLDALLVTANVREFSRVRGLRVEDWGGGG